MIQDNYLATTVSHAENCLYDIRHQIVTEGSELQKVALQNALNALDSLYMLLREE